MEIDDYDVSYSSICDRINGNPQQAKKELLRLCSMTIKAEEKVEKLEEELNKAKTDVRFFKKVYTTSFITFVTKLANYPRLLSSVKERPYTSLSTSMEITLQ